MVDLTKNEEIALLASYRLGETAYGISIRSWIRHATGKEWNVGTLHCTLDQLVKKGLVSKYEGKPLSERGGRRKIHYSVTRDGRQALQNALVRHRTLWSDINDIQVERSNGS